MPPTEWLAALRPSNFPDHNMRHRDFLGFIDILQDPYSEEAKDFDFVIGPGLADERHFSIQASNFPNHFLRHQDFRIKLQEFRQGDDQFAQDATFELTPALAFDDHDVAPAGISLRSFNLRDHFIRHSNFELWLGKFESTALFAKDASFHIVDNLYTRVA